MESTFLYTYNFTRYHEDTDKEGETLTVVPKETGEKTYLSLVGKQFASQKPYLLKSQNSSLCFIIVWRSICIWLEGDEGAMDYLLKL